MRQNSFQYRNNMLHCENIAISKIVKEVGSPVYIYSRKAFIDHFQELTSGFKSIDHVICFSVKANSNISVLRNLVQKGCGLDIVSGGELTRSLKAGCKADKIVFSGVGKSKDEIAYAIRSRILMFNIESAPELERIANMATQMKRKVITALRVNPDVDPKTHKYITTGKKGTKFGLDFISARKLYKTYKAHKYLTLTGVHAHIGSQITTTDPFVRAIKKLSKFIEILRKDGVIIDALNMGGGLGIVYKNEKPQSARAYAKKILPYIKKLNVRLILEPGRFIAGNAGIFVTRVEYVKKTGKKNFVIVDGAMNDLIRPSLYEAYHEIVPVKKTKGAIVADIVGPVCETGDFFAKGRKVANVKEGDLLACLSAGAYGFVMASNYNTRPRVPEVFVDKNKMRVIRRRERVEDLLRLEY